MRGTLLSRAVHTAHRDRGVLRPYFLVLLLQLIAAQACARVSIQDGHSRLHDVLQQAQYCAESCSTKSYDTQQQLVNLHDWSCRAPGGTSKRSMNNAG